MKAKAAAPSWPQGIHALLMDHKVKQVAYVPDAGHSQLIRLMQASKGVTTVSLTTEEEGIAMLGGAWLAGDRGVMLMQSSGVGNCINMLGTVQECRFPLLMLVTMRGEWGEFNPWQVPMGQATRKSLEAQEIVRQCREAGVPVFVKQLGGWPDTRSDPSEWPEDLRVREFPARQLAAASGHRCRPDT